MSVKARGDVKDILSKWGNDEAVEWANKLIDTYGEPDEVTQKRLIWHDNGPWVWTMIVDEAIPHKFPVPHEDFLYQVASYPVNKDRADDVLKFDGSVILDPVKGLVGSRCHMEQANYITTNMAVEIMEGKRTYAEARKFMAESMKQNKNREYRNSLQFETQPFGLAHNEGTEAGKGPLEVGH